MEEGSEPRKRNREPKLTDARREDLLKWLRAGLPLELAAKLTGVHESTVRTWRARSRKSRFGYIGFDAEVAQALAEGEAVLVSHVQIAGKHQWRAAAWLLERMYPDRYGPPPVPLPVPDFPPVSATSSDAPTDFRGL